MPNPPTEARAFLGVKPEELLGPLNEVERHNAPKELFVAGRRDLLSNTARVSIVGSRKASPLGLRRAARLAKELAAAGVTVVSGLAEGIDAVAHKSAIENGGATIGVVATALDAPPYPRSNAALQREMMKSYLVISQFPSGYPTRRENFVMRNRTMALITNASVIVEAGESSGCRSQGWETLRLGRRLFFLKSLAESGPSWVQEQLAYGADILEDPEPLIREVGDRAASFAVEAAF